MLRIDKQNLFWSWLPVPGLLNSHSSLQVLGLFCLSMSVCAQQYPAPDAVQHQPPGLLQGLGQIFGSPPGAANPRQTAYETQQILQRINALELAQQYDEALELCDKGLSLVKQSPMAGLNQQIFGNTGQQFSNVRIRLLVKLNQFERAATAFRQSIDESINSLAQAQGSTVAASGSVTTLDDYILSLAHAGRLAEASEAIAYFQERLGRVIESDPMLVQSVYRRKGDIAYQLGQREKALEHYLRAWKGASEVAQLEQNKGMRSGGLAAIQSILAEVPNTSASLLTALYDDFDIDPAQLPYATHSPVASTRTGSPSDTNQSMPAVILRDLVTTAQELGRSEIVAGLYQKDFPAFIALQEKSSSDLTQNKLPSSLPSAMTTASQGLVELFLTFGQALEASGQPQLASEAYTDALVRSQAGLDQISRSFGSPRAAQRLYSVAIRALGRQVNLAVWKLGVEDQTRLASEVGLLKVSIHDRLLLVNRMPYEIEHAQARELQQRMQQSHEQVVATWNEKRMLDQTYFSNYASAKIELAKLGAGWLQAYVAKRFDRVALDRALAALPKDSAVIDYFLAEGLFGQSRYWVFVHRQGKPVRMLNLGDAREIDKWVAQLRQDILDVNESRIVASANRLGELLWAPVEPLLADATNVTISPDGQLLLLPYDVLRYKGKYLLEQVNIRMVNSLRDLTPLMTARAVQPTQSVLVGDPDFGLPSKGGNTQRPIHFDQLPGTRQEVMQIAQRLKSSGQPSKILLGKDASLENLRGVRSPKFLHLASHGYFLDEATEKLDLSPGSDLRNDTPALRGAKPSMPAMGIALEQANVASPTSSLLTADKISSIDLRGTELVVLSACDTGLGKFKTGEGVRSLRASFQIAGAKQVVASLWYVPDDAMKTLMDAFYQGMLAATPSDVALRKAKLELIKKNSNPFYWGAASVFTSF